MKKFLTAILVCLTACCLALSVTACGDGSSSSTRKPGPNYRTVDGEKILNAYVPEDGVDTFTVAQDVKKIKKDAFKDNASIKKIVITSNVTEIGAGAFAKMKSLEEIVLPFVGGSADAVNEEKVFGYVFGTDAYDEGVAVTQNYGTASETYYIPATLTKVTVNTAENYKLPAYAFNGIGYLTEVNLTGSVTEIGAHAFEGCYGLTKFEVPSSVTKIGDSAFVGCNRLTGKAGTSKDGSFVFAAGTALKEIGEKVFAGTRLTDITVPEGVEKIGKYAFASDVSGLTVNAESKLEKITLPSTLEKINDYAFFKCVNLTTVVYGSGLKSIGVGAFGYCEKLNVVSDTATSETRFIKIADGIKVYAGAFEFVGNEAEYTLSVGSEVTLVDGWNNGSNIR